MLNYLSIFLCCILCMPLYANALAPFVIGMPYQNAKDPHYPEFEAFLQEAYSRIGISVEFKYMPLLRDLEEANDKVIDASAARDPEALAGYPNLVQVPTPIITNSLVAFTTKPGIKIHGLNDLAPFRIGILRGNASAINAARQVGAAIYLVNTLGSGFNMLSENRLDVLLNEATLGSLAAKTWGHGPIFISAPLKTSVLYHTLNKAHAQLVPKLAKVFDEMFKDGTTQRLFGKFTPMLPNRPH